MQATDTGLIDPRELMKQLTVEELCQTAEEYFASRKNWDDALAKPFSGIYDTPHLLIAFAHVLQGLELVPEMSILDFGAGSCWASKWLTQLGLRVYALDVSPTALRIGKARYARQPVFGDRPSPRFVVSNGRKIPLGDGSLDRIICLDTFHHIPNQAEVLSEMSRVLKKGGIAGFSEPGPDHSKTPQSQSEMRNFKVLENDIVIREIWFKAKRAGFARMMLAVFNPELFVLPLAEFEDYLSLDGGTANQRFARSTQALMQDRRLFFLYKEGEKAPLDSRQRGGLKAQLNVTLLSAKAKAGTPFIANVVARNSGQAVWLPITTRIGSVSLGCHLLDATGKILEYDYFRHPLTPDARAILPGQTAEFQIRIPSPPRGRYVLEFDLVSESVCWFTLNGSQTIRLAVEVF